MAEKQSHRSFLRDASGPRAVDTNGNRDRHRGSSRRQRDCSDRETSRLRRNDTNRAPKSSSKTDPSRKENSHRRKQQGIQSIQELDTPTLELQMYQQPSPVVQLGYTVEQTTVVSLKGPSCIDNIDTSSLFTVTSLVADTRYGDRVALEAGCLIGQKSLDSIHPFSPENVYRPNLLGYSYFGDLLIRQHGTYRIRTTLMKMGAGGAFTLDVVDSDPIKVERPNLHRYSYRT